MRLILIGYMFAIACTGCTLKPAVSEADLRSAYATGPGPHPVTTVHRTELDFPAAGKRLQMRLAFPADAGSYPVIVFSHGNGCSQDYYAGFADHWASWGYVVIQPVHVDSLDLGFTMKGKSFEDMNEIVSGRRADVRFILDSLPQLEQKVDGLDGKIDPDRLIAAGHSMGAGTAMVLAGVEMVSPLDQKRMASDENRFSALILISEPSNNRMMPEEPWRLAKVPTFIATGTNDFSTVGASDGQKSASAWQLPENADFPDQPHWYLYMQDADHYFGGVICKSSAPGPADPDALKIANGASTAFLEAYIRDDRAARAFLASGEIGVLTSGRATLENRQ
jgi:predicted dienelactone hydrolase